MIKKNIAGVVTDLVSPVADEMGIILWDVEYVKEGSKKILRITIDSEEGIDINTCVERVKLQEKLLVLITNTIVDMTVYKISKLAL